MVPRGPGELGDEDAVGVRSGTMNLIHLDRIEHAYGDSKSASSSPRPGDGRQPPLACQRSECTDDLAFHRTERYDLLGVTSCRTVNEGRWCRSKACAGRMRSVSDVMVAVLSSCTVSGYGRRLGSGHGGYGQFCLGRA